MPRPRWWRLAGVIAVLGLLVAPALPGAMGSRVLAHAQLVASSPGAGEIVDASPDEIRLIFSEALTSKLSSIDVVAQDGTRYFTGAGDVDPGDDHALVLADPGLPEGVYSVTWRSVSAADGHSEEGFFTFGIGDVAQQLPQVAGGSLHEPASPISIIGRWITYLGILLAFGLALFHLVVVRYGPMPIGLTRLLAAALAISSLATIILATVSALEAGSLGGYLFGSRNGLLQVARALVADLGAVALVITPRRWSTRIAGVTGFVGIVLLIMAGHAAALTDPVPIVAGVVHVAAAAAWIGGLAGLMLVVVRPGLVSAGAPPELRRAVPRFSALALVSIGMVSVTGVYSFWAQTGSLAPFDSEYGRTLVLKSVLALAAFGVGTFNYFDGGRMRPWLDGFRTRLTIESLTAVGVLVMTAVLSTTPPVDEVTGVAIQPIPDAFGEVAPQMELHVVPGRPGVNRVVVTTTDAMVALDLELSLDRLDQGTTSRVPLTAEGLQGMEGMEGMDHSSMVNRNDDGTVDWSADAIVLPAGSSWDTAVVVDAADGTELSRQRFSFTLSDDGIDEGRITSLLNPATGLALLLLVGGAIGLGLGLGRMALPRCEAFASRVALLSGGTTALVLGLLIGVQVLVT
jgi:copper transport protein